MDNLYSSKALAVVLGVLAPFAGATARTHTDTMPFGLERLTWGMTPGAAERKYLHLRRIRQSPEMGDPNLVRLGIDHFPIYGCDFGLSLEFYRGGLNAVGLAAVHKTKACKKHIKADLSAKYNRGEETRVPDLGVYNIDWRWPTGDIRYQENDGFEPRYSEEHLYVSFWRPNAYTQPVP